MCTVDECGGAVYSKKSGLCIKHYNRMRRNGTTESKHRHVLTGRSIETLEAICKECGPTKIVKQGPGWRCRNGYLENKRSHSGLTRLEAEKAREGQECFLCGSTEALAVDHCHDSMGLRGILCGKCNMAIGLFRDDPQLMEKAAMYVRNPPGISLN
jgi:hypothetical protein